MSTRTAIVVSVVWMLLVLGGGFGLLWVAWEQATPAERRDFDARAQKMGAGCGALVSVGFAAIWIPWALRRRANNRNR